VACPPRSPLLLGKERHDFESFCWFGFVLSLEVKIAGQGKCCLQGFVSATQGGQLPFECCCNDCFYGEFFAFLNVLF